jgi:1,4-dihydroxy-2-naphthoate polyprenyltransferase
MRSGIDLQTTRTPFSGGSGTLPSGALPVGAAVGVGVAGSMVGLLIGIYFVTQIGWWPLAGVMVLGAVAVLVYTQLFARTGAGEIFAGLGLGLLPVVGTALVQRGVIGPAAWAAGVPAFLMTFNLLLLNEFPDEKADRAGGRLNLVLMFGRPRAALVYAAAAVATPLSIAIAVLAQALPPLALIGCLPFWFAVPAVRWAVSQPKEPVPIPAMAGNVIWNLSTNALLAAGLGVAAYLGW